MPWGRSSPSCGRCLWRTSPSTAGPCVAEGIRRLRAGQVERRAGFDGEYGVISLLTPGEIARFSGQISLFGAGACLCANPSPRRELQRVSAPEAAPAAPQPEALNPPQLEAVTSTAPVTAVTAGPGTGKTQHPGGPDRLAGGGAGRPPRRRLPPSPSPTRQRRRCASPAGTASGRQAGGGGHDHRHLPRHLSETAWRRAAHQPRRGPDHRGAGAAGVRPKGRRKSLLQAVSRVKNGVSPEDAGLDAELYDAYQARLRDLGALDFDDLLTEGTEAGCHRPAVLPSCAGGRVSGYQRYPVPAGPVLEPERGAVRHRRPGPVHLRLPGRRLPVLPAASRGATWCKGNSPNRKLPLCSGHSGYGLGSDRS